MWDGKAIPSRSLSKIRLIYCGCAGFGQIFRSFSFNSHHYSPQTINTSDSNQHNLVTIANLGQAPIAGIHEAWYGLKGNHVALSKTGNSLPTSFGLVYHSQYGFIENL